VENIGVEVSEDSGWGRNGLGWLVSGAADSIDSRGGFNAAPEIFTGAPDRVQAHPVIITTIKIKYFLIAVLCPGFMVINVACSPVEY
jgi:hypothetical protein